MPIQTITSKNRNRMVSIRALLAAGLTLVLVAVGGAPAHAAFSVTGFGGSATNSDGTRNAQAGAHPDFTTKIDFSTVEEAGATVMDANVKDVDVTLPPGLVGNPQVAPTCTVEELTHNVPGSWLSYANCPVDSQVGVGDIDVLLGGTYPVKVGIFNIEAPPGAPALFGFNLLGVVLLLKPELRGSDYGLNVHVADTSQGLAILSSKITLWGVPADHSHDAERFLPGAWGPGDSSGNPLPSQTKPQAFMTAPMDCAAGPLATSLRARSWQDQDRWVAASFTTDFNGDPLQAEGCETVPFVPSFAGSVDTLAPDAPVGLRVKLAFPQDGLLDPTGYATGHLKKAVVSLPEGMTINPASADGLTACSDDQLKLGTNDPVQCGLSSKVGTVDATTPLLTEHFTGGMYVRSQDSLILSPVTCFAWRWSSENQERGLLIKLPGSIRANKDTGRIVADVRQQPPVAGRTIELHFKSGRERHWRRPQRVVVRPLTAS